jgi:hypothetical protein
LLVALVDAKNCTRYHQQLQFVIRLRPSGGPAVMVLSFNEIRGFSGSTSPLFYELMPRTKT